MENQRTRTLNAGILCCTARQQRAKAACVLMIAFCLPLLAKGICYVLRSLSSAFAIRQPTGKKLTARCNAGQLVWPMDDAGSLREKSTAADKLDERGVAPPSYPCLFSGVRSNRQQTFWELSKMLWFPEIHEVFVCSHGQKKTLL